MSSVNESKFIGRMWFEVMMTIIDIPTQLIEDTRTSQHTPDTMSDSNSSEIILFYYQAHTKLRETPSILPIPKE
jgi:hypothetical protein